MKRPFPPYLLLFVFLPLIAESARADVPLTFTGTTTPVSSTNLTIRPQDSPVVPVIIVQGPLQSVDHLFGKLSIANSKAGTLTFWIGPNTPIRNAGGLQLSLDDLRPGDQVTIQYQPGTLTVNWIEKL